MRRPSLSPRHRLGAPLVLGTLVQAFQALPSLASPPNVQANPSRVEVWVSASPVRDAAPFAALEVSPARAAAGSEVRFDASASSDLEASPLVARFDFDADGTPDTDWGALLATHRYAQPGLYRVRVEVRDRAGNVGSATHSHLATNDDEPPLLSFTLTPPAVYGQDTFAVAVDASASSDPEGGPLSFEFAIGPGPGAERFGPGSEPRIEHTVSVARSEAVPVTVTVRDQAGNATTQTRIVRVIAYDNAPEARLEMRPTEIEPGEFLLDASASTDPDFNELWDRMLAYRWDFEGDGSFDTPFLEAASTVVHRYESERHYRPTVEVRDRFLATSRATLVLELRSRPRFPDGVQLGALPRACGIELSWAEALGTLGSPSYAVYRTAEGGAEELLAIVDAPRYLDVTARKGRRYSYRVRARARGEPVLEDENGGIEAPVAAEIRSDTGAPRRLHLVKRPLDGAAEAHSDRITVASVFEFAFAGAERETLVASGEMPLKLPGGPSPMRFFRLVPNACTD